MLLHYVCCNLICYTDNLLMTVHIYVDSVIWLYFCKMILMILSCWFGVSLLLPLWECWLCSGSWLPLVWFGVPFARGVGPARWLLQSCLQLCPLGLCGFWIFPHWRQCPSNCLFLSWHQGTLAGWAIYYAGATMHKVITHLGGNFLWMGTIFSSVFPLQYHMVLP